MQSFIETELQKYWDFVAERHLISNKRKAGQEYPWTADPILREWSFTSVYRRLDPGTEFAVSNLASDSSKSTSTRLFNLLIYRCLGREATFSYLTATLGGLIDPAILAHSETYLEELQSELRYYRDALKFPVFSTAYMVPAFDWIPGPSKIEKITGQWQEWAAQWPETYESLENSKTAVEFYAVLKSLRGVGRFLASQVYVDCTYTLSNKAPYNLGLMNWYPEFHESWMAPGPGALTGLQRLTGTLHQKPPSDAESLELMLALTHAQRLQLGMRGFKYATAAELSIDETDSPVNLSLQDVQNTLCEFGKYRKIQDGTGKARRRYRYSETTREQDNFLAALSKNSLVELQCVVSACDKKWYILHVGHQELTEQAASLSGYFYDHKLCALEVPLPDSSKYDPSEGTNDPVQELAHHMMYGLGERVQPELYVTHKEK